MVANGKVFKINKVLYKVVIFSAIYEENINVQIDTNS